jgi:hypothetical protein
LDISTKRCAKCGDDKSLNDFYSSGEHCKKSRCISCLKEDKVKNWHKRIYFDSLKSSKKKNLPFDITPEYVLNLYKKQRGLCFWFGINLIPSLIPKDPQMPTLDRLDREKGYTKGNLVLACFAANIGRNETSSNRFLEFSNLLRK